MHPPLPAHAAPQHLLLPAHQHQLLQAHGRVPTCCTRDRPPSLPPPTHPPTRAVCDPCAQAAERSCAIETLERVAGRSCETGYLHLDALKMDDYFECVSFDVIQTKTSKLKKVPIVAGSNKRNCFYLKFGDYLALRGKQLFEHKPGQPMWLFPELQRVKNAGTKIGDYMTAVLPKAQGGIDRYAAVAATGLPDGISAGGIRPGCCNALNANMPTEHSVAMTGHELKGFTSFHEYTDSSLAMCMPGAILLAGWPALPWGQLGRGPSAPSLLVLVPHGISMELLNKTLNALFSISSCSAPALHVGGALRSMVVMSFAAMLMYHAERLDHHEMRTSCMKLEAMVKRHMGLPANADAREEICKWGAIVGNKFKSDNARLMGACADNGINQMAAALRCMGNMIGELKDMQLQLSRDVASMRTQLALLENQGCVSSSPKGVSGTDGAPTPPPRSCSTPASSRRGRTSAPA